MNAAVQHRTDPAESEVTGLLMAFDQAIRLHPTPDDDTRMQLLRCIRRAGRRGISQIDAARDLGLSGPTLSRVCDALEMAGLVTRTSHPTDRRIKTLHLTPTGEAQVSVCESATRQSLATAAGAISAAEVEMLKGILQRMRGSLADKPCQSCEGCKLESCSGIARVAGISSAG